MLSLTPAAVPALRAMGSRAQEVRLGLHLLAALMLSDMDRGKAVVCACQTRQVSAVRLLVSPASAGP